MAFRREAALAYGRAGKFIILGGENAHFELIGRHTADSYNTFDFFCSFRSHVIAATEALRSAQRQKLAVIVEDCLKTYSGNMTFSLRTRTSGTCVLASNPVITSTTTLEETGRAAGQVTFSITASGVAGDLGEDVGALISIEGVGTFYSTAAPVVNGDSTVTYSLSGPDLGPILSLSSGAGPYNVRILQNVFRMDEDDWRGPYHSRPSFSETPDGNDNPNRVTYGLHLRFLKPATDSRDLGRLEAGISSVVLASGRQAVVFNGRYTGYQGNNARAQYESAAESWAAGVLSSDFTGDFEKVSESFDYDDESATLAFELGYQEILLPEEEGGGLVAQIKDASFVATRRTDSGGRGDRGRNPVFADVNYSCSVDKTVTTHAGLVALYEGTIRPLILAQTKAKFGATAVYVQQEIPTFDLTGNTISTYISFYLSGVGSSVLSFSRAVSYQLDMARDMRKRLNGERQTYRSSSAFPDIGARVVTAETREGTPVVLPGQAIQLGGYGPVNPSTRQIIDESNGTLYQPPGYPPFGDAVDSTRRWNLMAAQGDTTLNFTGKYSATSEPLLTSTTMIVTQWLWGDVENQPPVGSGESGGSTEIESQVSRGTDGFRTFGLGRNPFAPPVELVNEGPRIMTTVPQN